MTLDPRFHNHIFDTSSVGAYLTDYADHLRAALRGIDPHMLDRACATIKAAAASGNRIFATGNGGSSAIADHLCCDLTKGTDSPGHPVIDATSLTANTALYSALANDFGFTQVFSRQINLFGREGDVLLAISSAGNSPNIVEAVSAARERGMISIGLSGFTGGALRQTADIAIHVDYANYGIVEDAHQAVMHVFAQFIAHQRDSSE